ncbi:MAG TPA: cysteine desulfurase [Anaerolineaceae bacterium]|nr:cysteine desulfurase [Anaerolineaceae bacterium]HOQ68400.1 cysteine desulfurase [Anaerolineaceae bacterium]
MVDPINQFDRSNDYKKDFPILKREVRPGVPIVYLDSAATSQKPESVIAAMEVYYRQLNANIHRGVHTLAEEATAAYEGARERITNFIGARDTRELIFTRNTTESINLVTQTWGRSTLKTGDLVILTEMEHHSNLVPWQMLAAEKGLRLEFIPVNDDGYLDLDVYQQLLKLEPKVVAFMHMSNVLGTINPAREIIRMAKNAGAITLLDAAQSIPHFTVDVNEVDADFIAFSAHKMLGPTGIGALWGKRTILENMPPFLGGGDMIKKVFLRSFSANDLPHKFEAGTPAIAEAIGFGAAVDYLVSAGMDRILQHEQRLVTYALEKLKRIHGLHVLGPDSVSAKGGVISFTLEDIHPHDIAQILDSEGIAVRAGHHCAMPLHERFKITASTRASFYLYNDEEDIDHLIKGLEKVQQIFR